MNSRIDGTNNERLTNWFKPLVTEEIDPCSETNTLSTVDQYPSLRRIVIDCLSQDYTKMYESLLGNEKFSNLPMEEKIMEMIRIDRHALRDIIKRITEEHKNDSAEES